MTGPSQTGRPLPASQLVCPCQGPISRGCSYTLQSNNGESWDLTDSAGNKLSAPAVCFTILPTDPEARALADRYWGRGAGCAGALSPTPQAPFTAPASWPSLRPRTPWRYGRERRCRLPACLCERPAVGTGLHRCLGFCACCSHYPATCLQPVWLRPLNLGLSSGVPLVGSLPWLPLTPHPGPRDGAAPRLPSAFSHCMYCWRDALCVHPSHRAGLLGVHCLQALLSAEHPRTPQCIGDSRKAFTYSFSTY